MRPWWERWPGRLDFELSELKQAGISYEFDDAAFNAETVQLVVHLEVDGEPHRLVVVFPDLYPDVRFEVYADDLKLAHHQNPFAKNLCLIGRDTAHWRPSDTLADVLRTQLPIALRTGQSNVAAEVVGLEERQAEPVGDFYPHPYPAMIFVDGDWTLDPSVRGGEILIGLEDKTSILRGMVLEVRNGKDTLALADEAMFERYQPNQRISGRWLRCDEKIYEPDPKRFWETITKHGSRADAPKWQHVGNQSISVVGAVFPDEVGWRRTGDGWVFLVHLQRGRAEQGYYFAQVGYAGRKDLAARTPELMPLGSRRVVIIGLGALGMPSALEFARSGVAEIRAIDFDIVDPGTAPRWPFGLAVAGYAKVDVLKQFVTAHHPYTRVKPYQHRVGAVRRLGVKNTGESDLRVLSEVLDGADLLYDATAEAGLHPILERLCRQQGIPYVCVSATNGAWGGTVVRTGPGTGCWHCFLAAQLEGSIPTPVEAPTPSVQPVGCASPTFTGSGFDLEQIVLPSVRLAVGALASAMPNGYPDATWDVAVLNMRDTEGQLILPQWHEFSLTPHPDCPACGGL